MVEENSQDGKEREFLLRRNFYFADQKDFENIPSMPIVYWISKNVMSIFKESKKNVYSFAKAEGKNVTTENAKYIRYFWEVNNQKIGAFDYKWLPCAMGGEYRKWYGNVVNVIDWSREARHFYKTAPAGRIIREEFWNMTGVTWGKIGSSASNFRFLPNNQMYQETAVLQKTEDDTYFVLAILNSIPATFF